jgi:Xaa-Pro aminopeptidase
VLEKRLDNLRERVSGFDGFLISSPINIHYLTGSPTDINGIALITKDKALLLTDFRFKEATNNLPFGWERIVVDQDLIKGSIPILKKELVSNSAIGFESLIMNASFYLSLKEVFSNLKPTTRLIENIRAVKDQDEIKEIKKGALAIDGVFNYLSQIKISGLSEKELVLIIEDRLKKDHLAEGFAFEPIIVSGPRGALPHGRPTDQIIEQGQLLTIDFGARFNGYHSDATRTWAVGDVLDQLLEIHSTVLKAQKKALKLVQPGAKTINVHQCAKEIISQAGYGQYFNHGTGHGVGLEIHEEPRFRDGFDSILKPGNVVTVEPGIYIPGLGGVRIEDLVLVTKEGQEVLTSFPKEILTVQ